MLTFCERGRQYGPLAVIHGRNKSHHHFDDSWISFLSGEVYLFLVCQALLYLCFHYFLLFEMANFCFMKSHCVGTSFYCKRGRFY